MSQDLNVIHLGDDPTLLHQYMEGEEATRDSRLDFSKWRGEAMLKGAYLEVCSPDDPQAICVKFNRDAFGEAKLKERYKRQQANNH